MKRLIVVDGSRGRRAGIQENLRVPTPVCESSGVFKTHESSGLSLLNLNTSSGCSAFQLHLRIAVQDTNDFRLLIRMSGDPGDNAVLDACAKEM